MTLIPSEAYRVRPQSFSSSIERLRQGRDTPRHNWGGQKEQQSERSERPPQQTDTSRTSVQAIPGMDGDGGSVRVKDSEDLWGISRSK